MAIHEFRAESVDTYSVKPLIKWAGGKRQIAPELFSRFPQDWHVGTYVEPFFGGGAVFLHIEPKKSIIADLNARLFGFYMYVKNKPDELHKGIFDISKEFNATDESSKKNFYMALRLKYNESPVDSFDSAVLLYALNKLCFNGLYRENSKGGFNVPFGQKKQLACMDLNELKQVSEIFKTATILNADFETTLSSVKAGDFVYLDPPYIPLAKTPSFTSYHSDGFGLKDQERLADAMLQLKSVGVKAMCSNSDTPLTRAIFSKLYLAEIEAPRMVSAKATGRGSVSELVITNYK